MQVKSGRISEKVDTYFVSYFLCDSVVVWDTAFLCLRPSALPTGVKECSISQHGTCDCQEPVSDSPQCSSVCMSSCSEGLVLGFTDGIVLQDHIGPVVDGIGQSVLDGLSSDHGDAFSGSSDNWGNPAQTPQGFVVSCFQGISAFGEEGRQDPDTDSRDRAQDCNIVVVAVWFDLVVPVCRGLCWCFAGGSVLVQNGCFARFHLLDDLFRDLIRPAKLFVDHGHHLHQIQNMIHGSIGNPDGHMDGGTT